MLPEMGSASAFSLALGTAALCAAMLHCGLHAVRGAGRGREHFWLIVAALGVVEFSVGNALAYSAQTAEEALYAQSLTLLCCGPLLIGFLRFTALFMERNLLWIEIPAGAAALFTTGVALAAPHWFFAGEGRMKTIGWLGLDYRVVDLTPLAGLIFIPFMVAFATVLTCFWQDRHRFAHPNVVVGSVAVWMATALNDIAVGYHLYSAPNLLQLGYLVFLWCFTVQLVRRFVDSLDHLEANAEELQHLVDERTAELRDKDLQVAHGARMATVGTLAAGLAREIQEPLGHVMRRVDDVAHEFAGSGPQPELDPSLQEARKGIERIRSIVSELLHVARRETGDFGPVDLNRVAEELLPIVRHEARGRTRLETRLGEIPPVEGDERLLGQVLLNLLLNAIHAIPPGAEQEHRVTVATSWRDGEVHLAVEDTGCGIPEELRHHVFEPFFTTREPGQGVGLGLSVTRQLVEHHRGQIDVMSEGRGSTFRITLPALDAEATS